MPRSALSFGIELEFSVATLLSSQNHRIPNETRFAHFSKLDDSSSITEITWEDVADHIRKTLANAGFAVKATPSHPLQEAHLHQDEGDDLYEEWEVDTDNSIRGPQEENGYKTVGIEVRSSAMYYMPGALQEVGRAVHLLTSTYLLHLNYTNGLHVHVGNGLKSFEFYTVQRLLAFLWAFEPQLNSLHPQTRFNHPYAASLRYGSRYSEEYLEAHGRRPRPLQGVAHFLLCKDWTALNASCEPGNASLSRLAYRFGDLAMADQGERKGLKLTVEFRQHCGSLNREEIQNWIHTTVGIVNFIIDSNPIALYHLFKFCEEETADGKDGGTVEPVLAETGFTMCHLLQQLQLWEPEEYYRRMGKYRIRKAPDLLRKKVSDGLKWGANLGLLQQSRVRAEMEALQRGATRTEKTGGFLHDPHDTSGIPDWKMEADIDASHEFSHFLNDVTDGSSSGFVLEGGEECPGARREAGSESN